MTRKKRKKKNWIPLLTGFGLMLAAGLILILAIVLLFGGRGQEEESETRLQESISQEASGETEEDPQAVYHPEEDGAEVAVSTVKTVEGENDEITLGIDVSQFQGNIDWDQVKESEIDFVMVRIGYRTAGSGEIREDQCAKYNLQEAAARGIHLGAYFFSTAVTEEEAKEEAGWAVDFLAGYPVTYPVAYNCEGFQTENSRQFGLSVEERTGLASAFLDEIEAGGYTGMFYGARNELNGDLLWMASDLELRYRMWVACYPTVTYPDAGTPDYQGKYSMWQYTNQGKVPGIDGAVDLDVAYFGYDGAASALQEGAAGHVEADPEVGVTFEEVNEQVTSKDVTNLRSTMEQSDDSNVAAKLKNGETATRTGKGNNGWSRVEYNGQILYAVSSYLTTDLSFVTPAEEPDDGFRQTFTEVNENVTAKDVTNLRSRPSMEDSEVIAQLTNGQVLQRTGVSDMGWSRLIYNGQTVYCISSYLQAAE